MPELPEVETVVRQLRPEVVGQKFWKFESKNRNTFLPGPEELESYLPGKVIEGLSRRGKYIIFELSEGLRMVVHLRMTGMLSFEKLVRDKRYVRGVFTFASGRRMLFSDIRRFGKVYFGKSEEVRMMSGMARLGVDPILDAVDGVKLREKWPARGGLKAKLLDQAVMAGIGNIYADEICFRMGLDGEYRIEWMTDNDLERLLEVTVEVLREGIEQNGTTISDFRGTRGDAGKYQDYLRVYGRVGDLCYVCGTEIKKKRVAGRGTFYCSACQRME